MEETIDSLEKAEQEREAKRQEMEQLTFGLLSFDSESLGSAVKCYISEEKDT